MFTQMKDHAKKFLLALSVGAIVLAGAAGLASAAEPAAAVESSTASRGACAGQASAAAATTCPLNQLQPATDGGAVAFGGAVQLSQSFRPSVRGPVCQVRVKIRRNTTAGAGALKLSVIDANGAVMDSAAILVAPPLGTSIQTFNMGCDGRNLLPGQSYRLRLEAPNSLVGTYSWFDMGGNPYPNGQGSAPLRDYTFWVYMCPQ